MTAIDLNQIPHPRDCHRVPVGATIPAGTLVWCMPYKDQASYGPASVDWVVKEGGYYLTAEPIPAPVPAPTPEDSPIIASGREGRAAFEGVVLMWLVGAWRGWHPDDGHATNVATDQITDWQPAIVTPTGHGVLDDRDKRDRRDADGDRWAWNKGEGVWSCGPLHEGRDVAAYLATVAAKYGPLRFADEEADR